MELQKERSMAYLTGQRWALHSVKQRALKLVEWRVQKLVLQKALMKESMLECLTVATRELEMAHSMAALKVNRMECL